MNKAPWTTQTQAKSFPLLSHLEIIDLASVLQFHYSFTTNIDFSLCSGMHLTLLSCFSLWALSWYNEVWVCLSRVYCSVFLSAYSPIPLSSVSPVVPLRSFGCLFSPRTIVSHALVCVCVLYCNPRLVFVDFTVLCCFLSYLLLRSFASISNFWVSLPRPDCLIAVTCLSRISLLFSSCHPCIPLWFLILFIVFIWFPLWQLSGLLFAYLSDLTSTKNNNTQSMIVTLHSEEHWKPARWTEQLGPSNIIPILCERHGKYQIISKHFKQHFFQDASNKMKTQD